VGGSMIRVQLADGVDASAAAALAEGVVHHRPILTPTRTGFSVSLANANQAADILIALRTNHIDIENAAIEQPSLDEVFLALTGSAGVNPVVTMEVSAA
jgi:ABC-2 type transport system ATP-binding protein